MKTVTKSCLECQQTFEAPLREVNRGNGKFCNLKCSGLHNAKQRPPAPTVQVICKHCRKPFVRRPYRMKAKTGLYFCSVECHNTAAKERLDLSLRPNWTEDASSSYRKRALEHYGPICSRCKYTGTALQAHHIDENRSNNDIKNLMVLCSNCHIEKHAKEW